MSLATDTVTREDGGEFMVERRKLIEVSLPLEAINRESAREKSIRHGHPSTLHLWWARRPLAAARAVLFAQLVDDPSSHPEEFPTEEDQRVERERLHRIIEELVVWENIRDERVIGAARREIMRSTGGNPPAILDPFAGGGTIPLEAQRLGLEAHASDLNPVAVLINKALIEIPPKFRDWKPVYPARADTSSSWRGAQGLADDVRSYGEWMRDEAEKRIGHHYPKAKLPDGSEATVIAWIWARTITCPNPACGIEMPLMRSWWLGKKKGKEAYLVPRVQPDPSHPSGKRIQYDIGHDPSTAPTADEDGTVGRNGAVCIACGTGVDLVYVRDEAKSGRMGSALTAIVAEGTRARHYVKATDAHTRAARIPIPARIPEGSLPDQALGFRVQAYGMLAYTDLFTNRQLTALTTFSDLVAEARERVLGAALASGLPAGHRLADAGSGAEAYADAVATYLGLASSRFANYQSTLCRWRPDIGKEQVGDSFSRQAIPMIWDFAEAMPFSNSAGGWDGNLQFLPKALSVLPANEPGFASATNAADSVGRGLLATDPPYYDNIGYSDLSDFFYVWLRRSLHPIHPSLFSTMLVPKAEELVANPYRYGGKDAAKEHFETGFREVFTRARQTAPEGYPATVYYAFKQSDSDDDGTASSGWETLLESMIRSGWAITGTWPMRSELGNRQRSQGSNALASSIVLALRPRPEDAPSTDRRGFLTTLRKELPPALRELQQGLIAPVDLPQAVIGPGMAVFSRYGQVVEPDGSGMTVRAALARINEILDEVLSEQEGDFDAPTRFAIAWYRQHGYAPGQFGDADNLARARNTAVATLERSGILTSRGGKVQLLAPDALPPSYDVTADEFTSVWEVAHHAMRLLESAGAEPTQALLRDAAARTQRPVDSENVKELAFLLFSIAEKNSWTKDALRFNTLATSWADIRDAAPPRVSTTQDAFNFIGEDL
jgi:putative DNA methylase